MVNEPETPSVAGRSRPVFGVLATALALALAFALGLWAVFAFVEAQRARDLRAWQTRLAIVAESRVAAIDRWFAEAVEDTLAGLAANESVQVYLTALASGDGDAAAARARAGYLANLLAVTAERAGFAGRLPGTGVPANVRRIGEAGIGLYDLDGRGLAATPAMPPLEGRLGAFFRGLERGEAAILDLHRGAAGTPVLGAAVPVYTVQGDGRPSAQVGWVIGVRPATAALWGRLVQPGEVNETAENILLRRRGAVIDYVSPLGDGSGPLARRYAADTEGLAAARALAAPGGFVRGRDYREAEVLAVSRPLARLPWLLVAKVDRAEALAASDARLGRLLAGLLLALGLAAAAVAAVWRHGASRRAAAAAARYRDLARRFEAQERFLRLVTDSQPNAIYIADADGRYRFANAEAARAAGIAADDMTGKTLASVLGPAAARPRLEANRRALEAGRARGETFTGDLGAGPVVQSVHLPLPAEDGAAPAVLVVESDITEAVTERARRERTLDELVRTLMTVVDRRDPFAAHQSERTARLARAVAEEIGLDPVTVQTAEFAGNLMNLGKILVPEEVLTKTSDLSDDEMRRVRAGLQASAELIEGIEFDGPVVETLRQIQERWDGTGGPRGLAGEEILMPARVVAAANAFVAMISPRAYRDGVPVDAALAQLMARAGTAFDRAVVAALVSHMDNRGGRAAWEALAADGAPAG